MSAALLPVVSPSRSGIGVVGLRRVVGAAPRAPAFVLSQAQAELICSISAEVSELAVHFPADLLASGGSSAWVECFLRFTRLRLDFIEAHLAAAAP